MSDPKLKIIWAKPEREGLALHYDLARHMTILTCGTEEVYLDANGEAILYGFLENQGLIREAIRKRDKGNMP